MYAVEQGLALLNRSPQIDGLLGALLSKLEKDKPALTPPPAGSDDASYCERFALSVFARADRVDRAGRADKATSTAFYAASVFMEILNQFGPLAADVAEAQRYAAWKAADIRKALREGEGGRAAEAELEGRRRPGGAGVGTSTSLLLRRRTLPRRRRRIIPRPLPLPLLPLLPLLPSPILSPLWLPRASLREPKSSTATTDTAPARRAPS